MLVRWNQQLRHLQRRPPFEGPYADFPPAFSPVWATAGKNDVNISSECECKFDVEALERVADTVRDLAGAIDKGPHPVHRTENISATVDVINTVESWK